MDELGGSSSVHEYRDEENLRASFINSGEIGKLNYEVAWANDGSLLKFLLQPNYFLFEYSCTFDKPEQHHGAVVVSTIMEDFARDRFQLVTFGKIFIIIFWILLAIQAGDSKYHAMPWGVVFLPLFILAPLHAITVWDIARRDKLLYTLSSHGIVLFLVALFLSLSISGGHSTLAVGSIVLLFLELVVSLTIHVLQLASMIRSTPNWIGIVVDGVRTFKIERDARQWFYVPPRLLGTFALSLSLMFIAGKQAFPDWNATYAALFIPLYVADFAPLMGAVPWGSNRGFERRTTTQNSTEEARLCKFYGLIYLTVQFVLSLLVFLFHLLGALWLDAGGRSPASFFGPLFFAELFSTGLVVVILRSSLARNHLCCMQ